MFFFLHTFLEFEHNFFVVHLTGLTFFLVSPFQPQEFWDVFFCSEKVWILVKRLFDTHPRKITKLGLYLKRNCGKFLGWIWCSSLFEESGLEWNWNRSNKELPCILQGYWIELWIILDVIGKGLGSGMILKGSRIIEFLELPSTPFCGQ